MLDMQNKSYKLQLFNEEFRTQIRGDEGSIILTINWN